jgi:hypothetical protein
VGFLGYLVSSPKLISVRLIIATCGMTPVFIAFPELQTQGSDILEMTMNLIFAIDVVLNFFSAFYDQDYTIIDDYRVGFKNTS